MKLPNLFLLLAFIGCGTLAACGATNVLTNAVSFLKRFYRVLLGP